MNRLFLVTIFLLMLCSLSLAQYQYDASFPSRSIAADTNYLIVNGKAGQTHCGTTDTTSSMAPNSGLIGVAVDPDGKIWTATYLVSFSGFDSLYSAGDGKYFKTAGLHIFNPNGTQASFSPLAVLAGNGVADTLWKKKNTSMRGLGKDGNGNIIMTYSGNPSTIYQIDYKTGAVISKSTVAVNGTRATSDLGNNYYFIGGVTSKNVFAGTFGSTAAAFTSVGGASVCRQVECSPAGDTVYFPSVGLIRFAYDPNGAGFTVIDTLFKGFKLESVCRAGTSSNLWLGANNPSSTSAWTGGATWYTHYLYSAQTNTFIDSVTWQNIPAGFAPGSAGQAVLRPRGVATSTKGDTVYIVMYQGLNGDVQQWAPLAVTGPDIFCIQRFVKTTTGVKLESNTIPNNYSLSQNYPNPFNPSTQIKFSLAKSGFTTLRVFDILGRQIAELVSEELTPGTYKATFDAEKFRTGTYIYELRSGDTRLVKKMLLVK